MGSARMPSRVCRLVSPQRLLCAGWLAALIYGGSVARGEDASADASGKPRPVRVTGTVTQADGKPVPEATVYLVSEISPGGEKTRTVVTDAAGSWAIELREVPDGDLVAIARKAGHGLGAGLRSQSTYIESDQKIRSGETVTMPIVLEPEAAVNLRVVDPDGEPVRGAKLQLAALGKTGQTIAFYWRDPQVAELSWETDNDGRVALENLPAKAFASVVIATPQHGRQQFQCDTSKVSEEAVLTLLPVGRVTVSLSCRDLSAASKRKLRITSSLPRSPTVEPEDAGRKLYIRSGYAEVETNSTGTAEAILPEGLISVALDPQDADQFFMGTVRAAPLEPGQTVAVPITLTAGKRFHGRVQTNEAEPVGGVRLSFGGRSVSTSSDGSYEVWLPADQRVYGQVTDVPEGFTVPFESSVYLHQQDHVTDQTPATSDTFQTVILRKAVPIAGTVVDESGSPVAGARVIASWVQPQESEGRLSTFKSDATVSDTMGRFQLTKVYPDVDVVVTAQCEDAAVMESEMLHTSRPHELRLTVSPRGMVSIVGAVSGSDGKPLDGATIKISRALLAPSSHNYGSRSLEFNGQREFAAQADGSFQWPATVPRFGKYSLTIAAPGHLGVETPFLAVPSDKPVLDAAIIKLTKARELTGIVRDSAGNPVAGAEVTSWEAPAHGGGGGLGRKRTRTGDDGQFRLQGLHPHAALAFVQKEGFRRSGSGLRKDVTDIAVVIYRVDEPLPAELVVQPNQLDEGRRAAAARKLLTAILERRRNSNYFHREIFTMLARVNPDAVQAELQTTTSADTRARVLAQLGALGDALAEVESITDPYSRAFCRLGIADETKNADEIRDILAAALLDAQSIAQPDRRVVVVAFIADRFHRLGDADRVAAILREELPRAQPLAATEWAGYARGTFATYLAHVEPQVALQMISEADPSDRTRHYQNLAHAVAATNPQLAEEALGRIGNHNYVQDPAVRVAYRMGAVDLPRAIGLVEKIDIQNRVTERAAGWGALAMAIRSSDPDQSREFLERAFRSLPEQRGGAGSNPGMLFGAGLELLRQAEAVAPEKLTEYFWKAAELHPGPSGGAWSPEDAPVADAERQAQLALLITRYNVSPELAREVMDPVFSFWEERIGDQKIRFSEYDGTFIAMALTDPERAVDWAQRFDDKLDAERRRYIPQPWEVIGKALTKDRNGIADFIARDVFHRWVIDEFDF